MTHTCHALGCKTPVPPAMFSCRKHWFALPKVLRDAVWREYRRGQEIDKQPSRRYVAVQQIAVAYLAFEAGDREGGMICRLRAVGYRDAAVAAGAGDPFDGLDMERLFGPSLKEKS